MMKSKSLGKTEDKQMSHKKQQQQRTACDSMNKQQKNVCVQLRNATENLSGNEKELFFSPKKHMLIDFDR